MLEPDRLGVYFVLPDIDVSDQLSLAEHALKGGAGSVQLRMKDISTKEVIEAAVHLKALCDRHDALMIINDRLDIALASNASGVHLGQDDMPVDIARRVAGPDLIIGSSVSSAEEAANAQSSGADYVAVSPVFETPTKIDTGPALGIDGSRRICEAVSVPVVGIGGIKYEHIHSLANVGINSFAVVSEIASARDPEAATARLVQELNSSQA